MPRLDRLCRTVLEGMTLRITAISNEFVYPQSLIPRTLLDILEFIAKHDCKSYLLQPGLSSWESKTGSFDVFTYKRMPSCFRKAFEILERRSEPIFKALTSSFNPKIYEVLFKLLKSSDLIICYCIEHSIPALLVGRILGKPVIFIFGDVNYIRYYRGVRRVHPVLLRLLLVWEKTVSYMVDRIVVLGIDDKDFLVSSGIDEKKISVVPLSLDSRKLEILSRKDVDESAFRRLKDLKDSGFKILMFHGDLRISTNEFCYQYIVHKLAPKMLQRHSNIIFAIVGPSSVAPEKSSQTDERIIATGYVDNLYGYIGLADIGIAPLISGSGVKNKILEYFALGKPVVTTKTGVENLDIEDMVHCVVTDLGRFPDEISILLKKPRLMETLGNNARKYLEKSHSLDNYMKYVQIVKGLVK